MCIYHLTKRKQAQIEISLRIFIGIIVIIGWIVFLVLNTAFFASLLMVLILIAIIVKPRLAWLQILAIVYLFFVAWLYNVHGSYVSRTYWPLRLYTTLGGQSSCTRALNINIQYNANGMNYDNISQLEIPYSFCSYSDMRWADDIWTPADVSAFKGTNEDLLYETQYTPCTGSCPLASLFKEDYLANLGRGLTNGWVQGANPVNTFRCPKTTIPAPGQRARGDLLPSFCLWTFVAAGKFSGEVIDYFPIEYYNPLCGLCPGYYSSVESENVSGIRAFFIWCCLWFILVIAWSLYTCFYGFQCRYTKLL